MKKIKVFGLFLLLATACGGRTQGDSLEDYPQQTSVGGGGSVCASTTTCTTGGSASTSTETSSPSIASNATGGHSSSNATTTQPTTTVAGMTSIATSATGGASSASTGVTGGSTATINPTGGSSSTGGGSSATGGTSVVSATGGASSTGGSTSITNDEIFTFDGPAAGTAWGGVEEQILYNVRITSPTRDINVNNLPFSLSCDTGGRVIGSLGTPYFNTFEGKSLYDSPLVYLGPTQMSIDAQKNDPSKAWIHFPDDFIVKKGTSVHLAIMMYISATEDVAGELFGHSCKMALEKNSIVYTDMQTGVQISGADAPFAPTVGNSFQIQKPQLRLDLSSSTPKSQVVVPNLRYLIATHYLTNSAAQDLPIDTFVASLISPQDFRQLQISVDGKGPVLVDPPSGDTSFVNQSQVTFKFASLTIPAYSTSTVLVYAFMDDTRPSSIAGTYARSGDKAFIRFQSVSGPGTKAVISSADASAMTLHKGAPLIIRLPTATNVLMNGDNDLIKFQVSGNISWKAMTFAITNTGNAVLHNFRLRKGATDIDAMQYWTPGTQAGWGDFIFAGSTDATISTVADDEQFISEPAGVVYTLHALVTDASPGSTVAISFYQVDKNRVTVETIGNVTTHYPGYLNIIQAGQGYDVVQRFIWSDMSETPHSAAYDTGSADWINGALLINTDTSSQVLVR